MKLLEKLKALDLLDIANAVDSSLSLAQTISTLGIYLHPRDVKIFREFLLNLDLDISHFSSNGRRVDLIEKTCPQCNKKFKVRNTGREKNQKTCSTSCYNRYFRTGNASPNYIHGNSTYRDKALKVYGHKCYRCGYTEVVEVHHIDRDRTNNDITNLIVLCPNCHVLEHRAYLNSGLAK